MLGLNVLFVYIEVYRLLFRARNRVCVYYQSFKVVITDSNGRESISLNAQRSECDVGMLEWMMSDSDIFRLYVPSTHNGAKTGTGLLAVI